MMLGVCTGFRRRDFLAILTALVAAIFILVHCKKSPHIAAGEISQLTQLKVDSIFTEKKIQMDESASLEEVTIFTSGNDNVVAIFTPREKGYQLLRVQKFTDSLADAKLIFIAQGNGHSQGLLMLGNKPKKLIVFDAAKVWQIFELKSESDKIQVTKLPEKPNDEVLQIQDQKYRFNGFSWVEWSDDEFFPYLDTFEVNGDNSRIEFTNRGMFATRIILTISFPDLKGKNIGEFLKLTKNIPNAKLYPAGFLAHKKGGGNTPLAYPIIEIVKDSLGHNARIKLPLFMNNVGKISLRAVYSQRGTLNQWPAKASNLTQVDQQNYDAFIR